MLGVWRGRGRIVFAGLAALSAGAWGCSGLIGDFSIESASASDGGSDTGADTSPSEAGDGSAFVDGSADAPSPAPDGPSEAMADVEGGGVEGGVIEAAVDAPFDAPVDAGTPIRELYLITASGMPPQFQNDVDVVDLASGKAISDVSMNGAVAVGYGNGNVYVAQGSGRTRISILQPGTLNTVSTLLLSFDPAVAVFRPDASSVFAATAGGTIQELSLPSGSAVGASFSVPLPSGSSGSPQITGLALDPSGKFLGVTEFSGSSSSVAIVTQNTTGSWTVGMNVSSAPISGSNCSREALAPAFSPDGALLSTFDPNCGAFDVYQVAMGTFDVVASARLPRPSGTSFAVGSVWDGKGQVWAANYMDSYRTSAQGPGASFLLPNATNAGTLAVDDTRSTLYFIPYDPHSNGAYTLDLGTGAGTALNFNLALIPQGSNVTKAVYIVR